MHDNVYDCLSSKTLKEVIKIIKDWIKRGEGRGVGRSRPFSIHNMCNSIEAFQN